MPHADYLSPATQALLRCEITEEMPLGMVRLRAVVAGQAQDILCPLVTPERQVPGTAVPVPVPEPAL